MKPSLILVLAACGEKLLVPVHPDVVTDWRCADINTVDKACPDIVPDIGVGELVYIGATWEGVCEDKANGSYKRMLSGGYRKACREQEFTVAVHCDRACRLDGDRPLFDTIGPATVDVTLTRKQGASFTKHLRLNIVDPDPGSLIVTCRDAANHEVKCVEATAASFCVSASVDHRTYVATDITIDGTRAADIDTPRGTIDLPSRPACHPVPLGASLDIGVGKEHRIEVFGPAPAEGYQR